MNLETAQEVQDAFITLEKIAKQQMNLAETRELKRAWRKLLNDCKKLHRDSEQLAEIIGVDMTALTGNPNKEPPDEDDEEDEEPPTEP